MAAAMQTVRDVCSSGLSYAKSYLFSPEERTFTVVMYENDYKEMCSWVLKHPNIETGGDLFGLWKDKYTAVVQLVLGPGEGCRRTSVSFYQDVNYLKRVGSYLTGKEGLCHIGEWHSHHTLGLARPSGGDENTVWSNMPSYQLQRFFIFIANISHTASESLVNVGCFLFEIEDGAEKPVLRGNFEILSGASPMRLHGKIMQHVHKQEESPNSEAEIGELVLRDARVDGTPTVAGSRKRTAPTQRRGKKKNKKKNNKSKNQSQQAKKARGCPPYDTPGAQSSKQDQEMHGQESEESLSEEDGSDDSTSTDVPQTHASSAGPYDPPEPGHRADGFQFSARPQTDNDSASGTTGSGSHNNQGGNTECAPDEPNMGGKMNTAAATESGEPGQNTGGENRGGSEWAKGKNQAGGKETPKNTAARQSMPGQGSKAERDKGAAIKRKEKEEGKEDEDNKRKEMEAKEKEQKEEGKEKEKAAAPGDQEITVRKQEGNGATGHEGSAPAIQEGKAPAVTNGETAPSSGERNRAATWDPGNETRVNKAGVQGEKGKPATEDDGGSRGTEPKSGEGKRTTQAKEERGNDGKTNTTTNESSMERGGGKDTAGAQRDEPQGAPGEGENGLTREDQDEARESGTDNGGGQGDASDQAANSSRSEAKGHANNEQEGTGQEPAKECAPLKKEGQVKMPGPEGTGPTTPKSKGEDEGSRGDDQADRQPVPDPAKGGGSESEINRGDDLAASGGGARDNAEPEPADDSSVVTTEENGEQDGQPTVQTEGCRDTALEDPKGGDTNTAQQGDDNNKDQKHDGNGKTMADEKM